MRKLFYVLAAVLAIARLYSLCDIRTLRCFDTGERQKSQNTLFDKSRQIMTGKIRAYLPSPESELLLGVLLGVDDISKSPTFEKALQTTGVLHVVVVSGYNINVLYLYLQRLFGNLYTKRNFVLLHAFILAYVALVGFDPPVVRSWLMTLSMSLGVFFGRRLPATKVLFFVCWIMILVNPAYIFSLSFQLSFLATLGLIIYGDSFADFIRNSTSLKGAIFEDLATTLSAQLLVWPLISHVFGRISIISPLVNFLVLWTIPYSTLIGGVFLLSMFVAPFLSTLLSYIVFVPLRIFVVLVEFFGKLPFGEVSFSVSITFLLTYYSVLGGYCYLCRRGYR